MTGKKSPSFAIGAFIVGAIVLIFLALLFFSGGRLFADKERVVMYFDGSVQGLQVGAPIKLKGVVLGQITDIQINFQSNQTIVSAVTADLVMARISNKNAHIDGDFLAQSIERGLRAQLNYQSFLTGLLYVELDFYPESPLKLYEIQDKYTEIPTIATSFEELSNSFQELDLKGLVTNINDLATQISDIVGDGEIQQTLTNFNRLTTSLERTSTHLDQEMTQLSKNLNHTLNELDIVLDNINTETPKIAKSLDQSLQDLQESLHQLDRASVNVENIFSEDSRIFYQLNETLENVSRSAQAFQSLSETLDQQPEALLRGRAVSNEEE